MAGAPGPVILGHEMAGVVDAMASDISTDSMGRPLKEGTASYSAISSLVIAATTACAGS